MLKNSEAGSAKGHILCGTSKYEEENQPPFQNPQSERNHELQHPLINSTGCDGLQWLYDRTANAPGVGKPGGKIQVKESGRNVTIGLRCTSITEAEFLRLKQLREEIDEHISDVDSYSPLNSE